MNTIHTISHRPITLQRIGLLLRADLYTQRRSMLYSLGALFLLIFIAPRLGLLLPGTTYSTWSESISSSASGWRVVQVSLCGVFGALMSLVYLNRRVQHAHPIAFSLLPASLWEKIIALGLFTLGTYISPWIVFALSEVLTALTVQANYELNYNWYNSIQILDINLESSLVIFLFQLSFLLTLILTTMSFKRLRVAIFVGLGSWLLSLFFMGLLVVELVPSLINLSNSELIELFGLLFLLIIDLALLYACYYRLKTLEL